MKIPTRTFRGDVKIFSTEKQSALIVIINITGENEILNLIEMELITNCSPLRLPMEKLHEGCLL